MRERRKRAILVLLCGLAMCHSQAQEEARPASGNKNSHPSTGSGQASAEDPEQDPFATPEEAQANSPQARLTSSGQASAKKNRTRNTHAKRSDDRMLSMDDRLSVLASALDSKTPRYAERDCSHLVHAIYERAGFPYTYASSDDLYFGVDGFQRVTWPQPGDLVVWPGHVGIVIRPSRHVFFSFLHAGPGIDDYTSRYWVGRGEARFYRYIKNDSCAGCTLARGRTGERK